MLTPTENRLISENDSLRAELEKLKAGWDYQVAQNERLQEEADASTVVIDTLRRQLANARIEIDRLREAGEGLRLFNGSVQDWDEAITRWREVAGGKGSV